MKNLYILCALVFFWACTGDEIPNIPETLKEGGLPQFTSANDTIINFSDLDGFQKSFSVDLLYGEATQLDVMINRNYATQHLYKTLAQWPQEVNIDLQSIVSALSTEISSKEDISVNDVFSFSVNINLPDGTVLKSIPIEGYTGYSPGLSIEAGNKAQVSYIVKCPSNLAGNYKVVSTGASTDEGVAPNPLTNLTYNVEIASLGTNTYQISDGVAGVYIAWYSRYGYNFETPGLLTDECGVLSGEWKDLFGLTITLSGTVDVGTGQLKVHWENDYGDAVDAVYTPQN